MVAHSPQHPRSDEESSCNQSLACNSSLKHNTLMTSDRDSLVSFSSQPLQHQQQGDVQIPSLLPLPPCRDLRDSSPRASIIGNQQHQESPFLPKTEPLSLGANSAFFLLSQAETPQGCGTSVLEQSSTAPSYSFSATVPRPRPMMDEFFDESDMDPFMDVLAIPDDLDDDDQQEEHSASTRLPVPSLSIAPRLTMRPFLPLPQL